MDFRVKAGPLEKLNADCLIAHVYGDKSLSAAAQTIDSLMDQAIAGVLALGDLTLKAGKCLWVTPPRQAPFPRVLLVCLGESPQRVTPKDLKACAASIGKELRGKSIKHAAWSIENHSEVSDQQFGLVLTEHLSRALYSYSQTKTRDVKPLTLKKFTFHSEQSSGDWKKGVAAGQALGEGANFARQLGNLPGNICTPTYLAEQAMALAEGSKKLSVEILDEKQMKKLKMGALLSVSAGSDQPAKLIVMEYKGGAADDKPTVLVGKGITFDTGGISIKPGPGMDEMKYDMCGAASVFGVMKTLQALNAPVNVVGVVAAAENMPSGGATKPGDVVTSMAGLTIEVLNTDAEGRLVLCDALTYVERFKPKAVIDIATLTGACVIALGNHATGLFANDQLLADELLAAGKAAQDPAWQMPLWEEYHKSLQSNFADLANIGGREAGSVTAACFLSRFAESYKWAHLDIAGTAWHSGAAKGASGRPVAMLLQYLLGIYK